MTLRSISFLTLISLASIGIAESSDFPTEVRGLDDAKPSKIEGSVFWNYFEGSSYGTKDTLTGVAEIEAGYEIHPPHRHAEEEFLMVIEGSGEWHINGKTFAAKTGDILYAAPWDLHGIFNTGDKPLKFVVFKWNSKGVPVPVDPELDDKH